MTAIRATTWSAAALVTAAVAGVVAGGVTAYLQGVLSENWNTVANSGAMWTVVAFAAALVLGRSQVSAVCTGTLVLVGEVVGYYSYDANLQHIPVLRSEVMLWTFAALWIGPLAGLGAFFTRWGRADRRVTALLAVCGVVAGEGVYLLHIAGVPRSGWVEIVLGLTGATAALIAVPAPPRAKLAALAAALFVAVSVYLAYRQPMIA
jgi:Family of unknown function (DUF6518)